MVEQSQQTDLVESKEEKKLQKDQDKEDKVKTTEVMIQTDDLQKNPSSEVGTDTLGDKPVDEADAELQTGFPDHPFVLPVGVPMYMPVPNRMYSTPYPVPIPVPVPVATPIFVPTVRNSENGVKKEIRRVCKKFGMEAQCKIKGM